MAVVMVTANTSISVGLSTENFEPSLERIRKICGDLPSCRPPALPLPL